LSEDDEKRVEKEIDRLMAEYQSQIEAMFAAKEKDILTI
jgi:ribosome recycling factor